MADLYLQLGDPANALKYARKTLEAYQAAVDLGASPKERALFLGNGYYYLGLANFAASIGTFVFTSVSLKASFPSSHE